jgi:hypothetical protein
VLPGAILAGHVTGVRLWSAVLTYGVRASGMTKGMTNPVTVGYKTVLNLSIPIGRLQLVDLPPDRRERNAQSLDGSVGLNGCIHSPGS